MARLIEVRVPDMGSFSNVAVIDVLVKPGESIEKEASLVTLETEKATMDVPSDVAGVIEKVHVQKGGTVSAGDVVATVRSEDGNGAGSDGTAAAGSGASGSAAPSAPQTANAAQTAQAAAPSAGSAASGTSASVGPEAKSTDAPKSADEVQSTGAAQSRGAARPSESAPGAAPSASSSAAAPNRAASSTAAAEAAASSSEAASAGSPSLSVIPGGRTDLPPIDEAGFSRAHAGPSVRKFARELGVDLTNITGTGFKGRITHDDVKAFVKKALSGGAPAAAGGAPATARGGTGLPPLPVVDFAKFGPIETKPLSRIQKISGPRLQASWVNIPHVTQFDEADITDLEDVRTKLKGKAAKEGIKLTPLAFIVRAVCKALQEFPTVNASLDASGQNLVLKKYVHIGFAADTPNGLMVPVIHDADKKDVYEIARALADLSEKARSGKLQLSEMQGGSFSISSLGGIGGTAFTPIINPPEVAILGVSRSGMKPFYKDGSFVPRLMLPLSLSYDHRVIDGAMAVRFTTFLAGVLADPRQLTEAVP
jgi:pyruvate dehydrogenase E2 component (dihydrolipoyllysine-residue acetyltransferase)